MLCEVAGYDQVVSCGNLEDSFFEDFAFDLTILSHPLFGLEVNCSKARALKVGSKDLMTLTKENVVSLYASGMGEEFVTV